MARRGRDWGAMPINSGNKMAAAIGPVNVEQIAV